MTWTLHLGDCLDVLRAMPDGSVDHVITDPPYEIEAHTAQRRVKRRGGITKLEPLTFAPITEAQRAEVGRHLARVARRWVLVFCQIEAAMAWRATLEAGGATYRRTCVWDKPDGMPQLTGDRPGMGYETFVALHVGGKSRWNGGGRRGVFTHSARWSGGERHHHPTEKPISLMLELADLFTDPGETVLDPFAGSGTTGVACLRRGVHFIGVEKDPQHWATARDRLAGESQGSTLAQYRAGQTTLFDARGGGVDQCR